MLRFREKIQILKQNLSLPEQIFEFWLSFNFLIKLLKLAIQTELNSLKKPC
jgi:hypothetical protein